MVDTTRYQHMISHGLSGSGETHGVEGTDTGYTGHDRRSGHDVCYMKLSAGDGRGQLCLLMRQDDECWKYRNWPLATFSG